MRNIHCAVDAKASCGEGLLWDPERACLWWVDIAGEILHRYDPLTARSATWNMPCLISATALRHDGALLIATARGIGLYDTQSDDLAILANPEPDKPGNRLNDMITGPDGSLWVGSMSEGAKGETGALYRFGPAGRTVEMTGTTISNGMGWSPDQATLYFIDSAPGILYAARQGAWHVIRRFDEETGKPDGMTVDADGTLWIAICDRGQVIGMTPEGNIVERIDMPCQIVTNCAFGGDDLKTLYVTTGTFSMTKAEKAANPVAGGLFAVQMDVPGLPPFKARWPGN